VSKRIDPGLSVGTSIPATGGSGRRLGRKETNAAQRAALRATRPKRLRLVAVLAGAASYEMFVFPPFALLAIPLLIAVLVMWYRWMVIARKWCLEHGDLAQRQAEIA
jgi:hypothetical protein